LAVANDQPRKDNVMIDLTSKALLAASIRVGIFGKRDSIDEALEYASEVIDNLQTYDKAVVYTALHVVLNTLADKIDALPDSSAAALEPPPAEVRIDHADLPATGAETFDSRVIELIENKLVEWQHQRNSPFDEIIKEWFKDNVDVEDIVLAQISELGRSIDKKIERAINDYDYGDVVSEIVRNMSFTVEVE
jgi:uncharacterized protein (DUF2267 family)